MSDCCVCKKFGIGGAPVDALTALVEVGVEDGPVKANDGRGIAAVAAEIVARAEGEVNDDVEAMASNPDLFNVDGDEAAWVEGAAAAGNWNGLEVKNAGARAEAAIEIGSAHYRHPFLRICIPSVSSRGVGRRVRTRDTVHRTEGTLTCGCLRCGRCTNRRHLS